MRVAARGLTGRVTEILRVRSTGPGCLWMSQDQGRFWEHLALMCSVPGQGCVCSLKELGPELVAAVLPGPASRLAARQRDAGARGG